MSEETAHAPAPPDDCPPGGRYTYEWSLDEPGMITWRRADEMVAGLQRQAAASEDLASSYETLIDELHQTVRELAGDQVEGLNLDEAIRQIVRVERARAVAGVRQWMTMTSSLVSEDGLLGSQLLAVIDPELYGDLDADSYDGFDTRDQEL